MNFKPIVPRLSVIAAAAVLAACSTLPAEAPPKVDLPRAFAHGQGLEPGVMAQPDWWTVFGDFTLDGLVAQGLAANLDLQQAAERVQRSRALATGRRAGMAPSGGIGIGGLAQQKGQVEAPGLDGDARRSEIVSAGLDFSWEIDLFGRLRQQANAAEARSDAALADAEALRLAVGAEIAQVWFALNGAREQLHLTHAVVENRRETLSLVLRRVSAGYNAALDEARARAELSAAESDLPAQEAALAVATHRLAVLLGVSPSGFQAPKPPAGGPHAVALRVPEPAQWMALRPDLRSAEARLRAQALDVAAIRAEFMPRLSIGGVIGFVAGSLSGLGAAGSASWFVAPSVSVPLFDLGRIDARLQAAQAGQREALLHYRQRVLLATEEVESALARVRQGQVRLAALQDLAHHAVTAERLARKRFEAGASDLLELLDAQRSAQQAALGLAASLTAQRQQVVALQRALGARFLPVAGVSQAPRPGHGTAGPRSATRRVIDPAALPSTTTDAVDAVHADEDRSNPHGRRGPRHDRDAGRVGRCGRLDRRDPEFRRSGATNCTRRKRGATGSCGGSGSCDRHVRHGAHALAGLARWRPNPRQGGLRPQPWNAAVRSAPASRVALFMAAMSAPGGSVFRQAWLAHNAERITRSFTSTRCSGGTFYHRNSVPISDAQAPCG